MEVKPGQGEITRERKCLEMNTNKKTPTPSLNGMQQKAVLREHFIAVDTLKKKHFKSNT